MKTRRFFVTGVLLIVITGGFLACTSKTQKRTAQVREGNSQIQKARLTSADLQASHKISLELDTKVDWTRMNTVERQVVREKLAEFVVAISRTFEIDAKKGLYITKKEILQRQLESALALQKSLDIFEQNPVAGNPPKAKTDWKPKSA